MVTVAAQHRVKTKLPAPKEQQQATRFEERPLFDRQAEEFLQDMDLGRENDVARAEETEVEIMAARPAYEKTLGERVAQLETREADHAEDRRVILALKDAVLELKGISQALVTQVTENRDSIRLLKDEDIKEKAVKAFALKLATIAVGSTTFLTVVIGWLVRHYIPTLPL